MKKRKVTSKQERNDLVRSFLNSGQTKTLWCKEHDIPLPTFYRWLKAYHGTTKEVSFVALKSKQAESPKALIPKSVVSPSVMAYIFN